MTSTVVSSTDQAERVIAFVVYPGLTLLDLVGPLQVLRGLPAPYRTLTVGEQVETVDTDTGLSIRPETTFADTSIDAGRSAYDTRGPLSTGSFCAIQDASSRRCAGRQSVV